MPTVHIVKEGEYLTLIARKHGFVTNKALIDANAALFDKRRDPNVLNPGDEIVIPPKEPVKASRGTGQTHEFRLKGHLDYLRLKLRGGDDRAIANQPFTMRVQAAADAPGESGIEITGDTDGEGNIAVALPPGAVKARLVLDNLPALSWDLQIGGLDPAHDAADDKTFLKGVQARLNNLGYRSGKVDGVLGPRTKAAIGRFQKKHMGHKEPTGELDGTTRDAIREAHGA